MEPAVGETSVDQPSEKKASQENNIDLEKCIRILVTDAEEPFAQLAFLRLQAVPRPGDMIDIFVGPKIVTYSVNYVNFNPYEQRCHITVGCKFVPSPRAQINAGSVPLDLKERMEQVTKSSLQVYEKAQAYTNAILLAGYAGVFGLWSFAKGSMTGRATNWVVLSAGVSLLMFISWEIVQMVWRAIAAEKFVKLVDKSPQEFFELLSVQEAGNRRDSARQMLVWKCVLIPTVVSAYLAAIMLIFNAAANIFGLTQWP